MDPAIEQVYNLFNALVDGCITDSKTGKSSSTNTYTDEETCKVIELIAHSLLGFMLISSSTKVELIVPSLTKLASELVAAHSHVMYTASSTSRGSVLMFALRNAFKELLTPMKAAVQSKLVDNNKQQGVYYSGLSINKSEELIGLIRNPSDLLCKKLLSCIQLTKDARTELEEEEQGLWKRSDTYKTVVQAYKCLKQVYRVAIAEGAVESMVDQATCVSEIVDDVVGSIYDENELDMIKYSIKLMRALTVMSQWLPEKSISANHALLMKLSD